MKRRGPRLLEKGAEERPFSLQANLTLGDIVASDGNLISAMNYFQNATSAPSPKARYNFGILFAHKDDLKVAAVHLDKTLKLKPDYSKAHN